MAPVGTEMAGRSRENDDFYGVSDAKKEGNLWASILGDVQKSSSTKLPACKNVLVLGDNESGKTTLIAKLQGNEDPRKGSGLEYTYIDVKDEYRDDNTRLGVYIVDGELHLLGLLKFALTQESFQHTLVLLVVSMAQPWAMLESLQRWADVLSTHIDRLKIPANQRREYEEALVRQFQEYMEPEEGVNPVMRRSGKSDEDKVLLPLGETTLTHNLGIPLVVLVTKSDAISMLEKEHEYREEHFDFIQQHIRKLCLKYGAALFYTSVKEEKNCDLLSKYMGHRIYNLPFTQPAFVVERDSVFVPFGWDNEKKISILYDSMTSIKHDDIFEDVIAKPVTRKPIQRDAELVAEDEQVFLMKQQTQLSKQPSQRESPIRPSPGVQKPTTSPRPSPNVNTNTPIKKLDGTKPGTPGNEGVLANFFNSLLSKKTGQAGGPSPGQSPPTPRTDRTAVNRDAAAELDRMTRTKKHHETDVK